MLQRSKALQDKKVITGVLRFKFKLKALLHILDGNDYLGADAEQSMTTYVSDTIEFTQPQVVPTMGHCGYWVGVAFLMLLTLGFF
jgi:hypothetical protein